MQLGIAIVAGKAPALPGSRLISGACDGRSAAARPGLRHGVTRCDRASRDGGDEGIELLPDRSELLAATAAALAFLSFSAFSTTLPFSFGLPFLTGIRRLFIFFWLAVVLTRPLVPDVVALVWRAAVALLHLGSPVFELAIGAAWWIPRFDLLCRIDAW